jgi:hypothetical protein
MVSQRIRNPGQIAMLMMWIVVGITAAGVLAFVMTHRLWYDCLDLDHRVSFWAEALVAYGTLALAIVTWGSVRESQDIVAGEDLRFRQSRMPMVRVVRFYREQGGVNVGLRNDGDGPARDVRITFDAHTILRWNDQGLADQRDNVDENDVVETRALFSSYMPVGKSGECDWGFGLKPTDVQFVNAEPKVAVKKLIVEYEDVFGLQYATEYEPTPEGWFAVFQFKWHPPTGLLAK